ncbi:MAG: Glycosyl transferase family 2 [Candidatus Woesebacteria bacterium GW2011_GWF2_46_8]|uniref:Glycosyl transferase family 2 n=1 Tax=Candidatus Woesebacteria bacterium GW2011_GWF2_46_8 TaxID=1618604 RepID=A0A0G1SZQ0_9BACT|nr:MAG: Glycosyl transferase family 2 [Candidatus Woesebacteria bacterium GW2011_GWF2_46_8]
MTLSVIIVNLNTKKLTEDCIKSILSEGSQISKEIIVVDNGSSDGSVEVLRRLKKEGKIDLVENKGNFGYAKANNQGIRRAKGKYLLLLNNDTIVHKGALGELVDFAGKTPSAGVVGSKLLNIDGTLQASCYRFPTLTNAIKEYWLGEKGLFGKYAPKGKKPVAVDALVGAAFLITPAAFKKVGILDERYFAYFEDVDYCRKVWQKGLKVYYLPSSEIMHYHGATFKKMAKREDQWRKLIPGSKIYHGVVKHYVINTILWLGQKWEKIFKKS